MKFSILLPTLGIRKNEIDRLFKSLSQQTYKDFEIVIVSQINHDGINKLIDKWKELNIKHIEIEEKGISLSRNIGLSKCDGEWIILSDDDCWYPNNSLEIINRRIIDYEADIILSQIYDQKNQKKYKNYSNKMKIIKNKYELMSKSSIEIAIKNKKISKKFDTNFGLGARFVCGEEVDFLLSHFKECKIVYFPDTTVYHLKKSKKDSEKQIMAKGALYAKNFNAIIAILICLRDLIKKKENNFKFFWRGYNEYNKRIYKSKSCESNLEKNIKGNKK